MADQLQYSNIALRDASHPSHLVVLKDKLTAIVIDDVIATVKVAGILQSGGKQYTLKAEGATNLEDLRNGPTIFIRSFRQRVDTSLDQLPALSLFQRRRDDEAEHCRQHRAVANPLGRRPISADGDQ